MQDLEKTIRRILNSYLDGEISLEEFTNWLVGATWSIEDSPDEGARELTNDVELALAEATSGLMGLEELHVELRARLDQTHPDSEVRRQPA